jgi:CRISPR-associated endonuclease/helicase Cas3
MEVPGANEFDAAIWKLALESVAGRTAIFVEQPEKAAKLRDRLQKEGKHCALLTGTMRGFERDRLLENADFRRFLESQPGPDPVWLVCTSAGEVGINFSCERMITGLREADHLLQRFGRLNRFGSPNPGYAYVLFRNPPDKESRLREALAYLRRLDGDISCAKLWVNRPPAEACEERPALARLESRLIDMWAQTTSPDRSVPPIQAWLHGKQESEPPDTELAWRSDIRFLTDWEISTVQITEILEYYPVLAREKLTEPTMRVNKKLAEILQRIGQEAAANRRLIVIDSDGSPSVVDLAFLVTRTQKDETFLAWKLILIPDDLGSVPAGMFSPAAKESAESVLDVADPVTVSAQRPDRVRFLFTGDAVKRVASAEPVKEFPEPLSISRSDLQNFAAADFKPALVIPHPENEETFLVYFGARTLRSGPPPRDIPLTVHMESVAERARSLVGCLGFDSLKSTYEAAGKCHDTGKNRSVWQYAMGGSPENPLAKSKAPRNLRLLNGYRHELGSLIDAESNRDLAADDLLLHLIASHHKGARPFFESRQYDVTCLRQSAEQSAEAARRYARLQTQYGAWGLAWLEAIFKCADGLVSGSEGEPASA